MKHCSEATTQLEASALLVFQENWRNS